MPYSPESPDPQEPPEQATKKLQNIEHISRQSPKLILLNYQNINLVKYSQNLTNFLKNILKEVVDKKDILQSG